LWSCHLIEETLCLIYEKISGFLKKSVVDVDLSDFFKEKSSKDVLVALSLERVVWWAGEKETDLCGSMSSFYVASRWVSMRLKTIFNWKRRVVGASVGKQGVYPVAIWSLVEVDGFLWDP
jgi:hypothetical protein